MHIIGINDKLLLNILMNFSIILLLTCCFNNKSKKYCIITNVKVIEYAINKLKIIYNTTLHFVFLKFFKINFNDFKLHQNLYLSISSTSLFNISK